MSIAALCGWSPRNRLRSADGEATPINANSSNGGKRKFTENELVKKGIDTKKPVVDVSKPKRHSCHSTVGKVVKAEFDQGKVAGLHYLLRMPLQTEEGPGAPAPLLLFLHGIGERGNEDGSEVSKVRRHVR